MDPTCHDGACAKCWGAKYIILGVILIVTQLYTDWDIWVVIGVLLILKGVVKLAMQTCGHCKPEAGAKKGKK